MDLSSELVTSDSESCENWTDLVVSMSRRVMEISVMLKVMSLVG